MDPSLFLIFRRGFGLHLQLCFLPQLLKCEDLGLPPPSPCPHPHSSSLPAPDPRVTYLMGSSMSHTRLARPGSTWCRARLPAESCHPAVVSSYHLVLQSGRIWPNAICVQTSDSSNSITDSVQGPCPVLKLVLPQACTPVKLTGPSPDALV